VIILTFDYGGARIGVAIKREDENASPLVTLQNTDSLDTKLDELVSEHQPEKLVVGRPRNLEGESTAQTEKAERFAEYLRQRYNKEVLLQDEALTSEEAETRIPTSVPTKTRKQLRDQYAALIILEDYLREAAL
jgi:putative Holliday junction resolvase